MSVKERNGRAKRAYLKGLTARLEDKDRKTNPYKFSEWGTGFAWLKGWNAADSAIKHDHLIPLLERAIELLADTAVNANPDKRNQIYWQIAGLVLPAERLLRHKVSTWDRYRSTEKELKQRARTAAVRQ
ncbi:MAG: hypothetical protein KC441_20760 [Anaerolineales bacterium]|nr:hypothetical protein [Anaerolineales bacterium]